MPAMKMMLGASGRLARCVGLSRSAGMVWMPWDSRSDWVAGLEKRATPMILRGVWEVEKSCVPVFGEDMNGERGLIDQQR